MCKSGSTSFRQFSLLEGAQQIFLLLFPQESLFGDAVHCVLSFVLVIEMNCPLHNIKELSPLDNVFATESVLKRCIETLYVLAVETE